MGDPYRLPQTQREIRWTDSAIDDLRFWKITHGEWKAVRHEVERIAVLRCINLDYAVCRVAQTGGEWNRIKITQPCQLRVFFVEEKCPPRIIVQAVLRRSERTYDICEILFKVSHKNQSA